MTFLLLTALLILMRESFVNIEIKKGLGDDLIPGRGTDF